MHKILIVEDEIPYLTLLHDKLTIQGYDVIDAKDGKEGLAMAKKHRPELILSDVRMPDMNGTTMLEKLRKEPYGKDVKVIFLTNLEPNDDMVNNVIQDKPTYYLIKSDIELSELTDKVKALLS